MERFTRFVPAPVPHVFAFVTLIEGIVAAIVLVFVAGGLLLSKVSDWPSYVVYQTTVLTIGVGAIAVMIAVLIGRGQVTVNVANSVSATAVAAANLPSVMSVGVRWACGYVGAEARAYCPDHDVMLLFKRNDNGEVERLTDSDAVSTEIHGGEYGIRAHGQLFCSDDGHTMVFPESRTFGEARRRAEVLIGREVRSPT